MDDKKNTDKKSLLTRLTEKLDKKLETKSKAKCCGTSCCCK